MYTEKPDFGYEVVCEAKIKDSGYYAEDVLSYEKVAKEQVRACGTELAYLKDFYHETFKVGTTYHYNKYSKTVYASNDYRSYSGASILGIRRNTDSAKIINDMPSKLGLAMGVDNVKVLRTLLKGLSKDPKQMSPDDYKLLQLSLHINASDGLNCPKKIVNELTDKYNIKLNFIEAKPFPDSKTMLPKDMIFCESVLVKSFYNFEDRLALMLYISKKSHELLENPSSKESKKIQYLKTPCKFSYERN